MRALGSLLLLVVLTGCTVSSINPFYKSEEILLEPQLTGRWEMLWDGDETVIWEFSGNQAKVIGDELNEHVVLGYFTVGEAMFVDITAAERDPDEGPITAMHTLPMHSVARVEIVGDSALFYPLNVDWVHRQIKENSLGLSHLMIHDPNHGEGLFSIPDPVLLTATSEELYDFLEEHVDNTQAFDAGEEPIKLEKVRP